jgi:hypothetical protein
MMVQLPPVVALISVAADFAGQANGWLDHVRSSRPHREY